ncbi:glycosyltransferase family 2 protein [Flavobacteriaceae bacterium]|nr:glycosyltransferase family 2 protein [Flavobacteriaceae bacterium]
MKNKLSIIIPTFKEGKIIDSSVNKINDVLKKSGIDFEILIIDDNSNDKTLEKIEEISKKNNNINLYLNNSSKGFGNSIIEGIKKSQGEIICFVMADQSDSPYDILNYYKEIIKGEYDCLFGDRWAEQQLVENYPKFKFYVNRIGNKMISFLFNINYSDLTNSFKMYKKSVLIGLFPLISNHFSITIEIPLKVIYRGFKYKVIPNSWKNNQHSVSNLNLLYVLKTYSLIAIYCLIERSFFKKQNN